MPAEMIPSRASDAGPEPQSYDVRDCLTEAIEALQLAVEHRLEESSLKMWLTDAQRWIDAARDQI